MSAFALTQPLTTVFTPPASCLSLWTYEAAYYNSIPGGLLIQNALPEKLDSDCFPSNFDGAGRTIGNQIYSPGACPFGYKTAGNTFNGATTTAICCPEYVASDSTPARHCTDQIKQFRIQRDLQQCQLLLHFSTIRWLYQ
jgi:hypothetical protein